MVRLFVTITTHVRLTVAVMTAAPTIPLGAENQTNAHPIPAILKLDVLVPRLFVTITTLALPTHAMV